MIRNRSNRVVKDYKGKIDKSMQTDNISVSEYNKIRNCRQLEIEMEKM